MRKELLIQAALILLILGLVAAFYEHRIRGLEMENQRLAQRLSYLEPAQPLVVPAPIPEKFPYPARQVLEQGVSLTFRTLELNQTWQRPVYIPLWHSTSWNCRRFAYMPRLAENNRHRVFLYQGGGSYWFDLSPAMGFTDDTAPMGIAFKTRDEMAIIALQARVKEIKKFKNQIAISIEPGRRGYHIVALPYREMTGVYCQVVTPDGYELEVPATGYLKGSTQ